jgi:hypothetical protein
MNPVERAGARSERETAAIGSADDSSLDPVDVVRGLAHMDVLRDRVRAARARRVQLRGGTPRTSAERHELNEGHKLTFGCCKELAA